VTVTKSSIPRLSDPTVKNDSGTILLIGLDGLGIAELSGLSDFKKCHPDTNIVALSNQFDLQELCEVIEAGADGYLLKGEIRTEALLTALDLILLGEAVLPRQLTQLMRTGARLTSNASSGYSETASSPDILPSVSVVEEPTAPRFDRLSAKEQLILDHLTKGATNKHIARELNVAEATVKVHVKAILRKVRVQNRTQAAVWAMSTLDLSERASLPASSLDVPQLI
jgi:two-component system nitrate/nitrite response regulator NarL